MSVTRADTQRTQGRHGQAAVPETSSPVLDEASASPRTSLGRTGAGVPPSSKAGRAGHHRCHLTPRRASCPGQMGGDHLMGAASVHTAAGPIFGHLPGVGAADQRSSRSLSHFNVSLKSIKTHPRAKIKKYTVSPQNVFTPEQMTVQLQLPSASFTPWGFRGYSERAYVLGPLAGAPCH